MEKYRILRQSVKVLQGPIKKVGEMESHEKEAGQTEAPEDDYQDPSFNYDALETHTGSRYFSSAEL